MRQIAFFNRDVVTKVDHEESIVVVEVTTAHDIFKANHDVAWVSIFEVDRDHMLELVRVEFRKVSQQVFGPIRTI